MNAETVQQGSVEVSVVFPAYNEADSLETSVERVIKTLNEFARSYEIIIAEDGSTDGTDKLAAAFAEKYLFVRHVHGEKRLGRGIALKNAFKQSNGKVLVYMDLDLATDLEHLKSLVDAVASEGYDLATGSRMLPESNAKRSGTRYIASKTYNFMVRAVWGSKVKDHQCGFKAFTARAAKSTETAPKRRRRRPSKPRSRSQARRRDRIRASSSERPNGFTT